MSNFMDLTGQRFGRLVALSHKIRLGKTGLPKTQWLCKCDCGNTNEINQYALTRGLTISCGCYHKEMTSKARTIHGLRHSRFYNIWCVMLSRTRNHSNNEYHNYGARGISVCDRWLTAENFKEDMYAKYLSHVSVFGEKNTSIERIDNEKGYSPENCKWATQLEQAQNKRNNVHYLVDGELLTKREISTRFKISINTLKMRIKKGWPVERMIVPPAKRRNYSYGA